MVTAKAGKVRKRFGNRCDAGILAGSPRAGRQPEAAIDWGFEQIKLLRIAGQGLRHFRNTQSQNG